MAAHYYSHTLSRAIMDGIETAPASISRGIVSDIEKPNCPDPARIALYTIRIAITLGVQLPRAAAPGAMPYSGETDALLFDAPLTGVLTGNRCRFLRGWKDYDSCVKCFNALGLVAEHALREMDRFRNSPPEHQREVRIGFLRSRTAADPKSGARTPVFDDRTLQNLTPEELSSIGDLEVALWLSFARRVVVCSTSSNMGISLHQALRFMQKKAMTLRNRPFTLFNDDEGRLIIWCPDQRADFMNKEKTVFLQELESEKPPLTTLHAYINRKQRDPGALKDALVNGGYFFPTNPQSRVEMQNLLSTALHELAQDRGISFTATLRDARVRQTLDSLGVEVQNDTIVIHSGAEGGLYGLMAPYVIMLEETLQRGDTAAVSTWNQASIGAALAATVMMDHLLHHPHQIPDRTRKELKELFPLTGARFFAQDADPGIRTRIHGLFDIANLQSLAQLFGVVVDRHLSGRGTAYVGLGSSSYANGNRCFEILNESTRSNGPFRGRDTLHPATHTLNPVAQAMIYAEDFIRAASSSGFQTLSDRDRIDFLLRHARKPEPAGAAGLAGYLLARLDTGTLSFVEIAYLLRLAGFRRKTFLEFCGYGEETPDQSLFVQEAYEEGEFMGSFAKNLLAVLDLPLDTLEEQAGIERIHSRLQYRWNPLDDDGFEALNPVVNIYLTGDNCAQPNRELVRELMEHVLGHRERIEQMLRTNDALRTRVSRLRTVSVVKSFFSAALSALQGVQNRCRGLLVNFIRPRMSRSMAKQLAGEFVRHGRPAAAAAPPAALKRQDILGVFERHADRTFLIESATGRTLTYWEFYRQSCRAAALLHAQGIRHQDRVILMLNNSTEFASMYFGCMFLGAVAVPVNVLHHPREIAFIVSNSGGKMIVHSLSTLDLARQVKPGGPDRMLCLKLAQERDRSSTNPMVWSLDDASIPAMPGWTPMQDMREEDLFSIGFTSGTTGVPKAVAHRVRRLFENAEMFNRELGFGPDHRFYHVWPMAYSTGFLNSLICPFMAGAGIVLDHPFDARSVLTFWKPMIRHQADTLWMSPTMLSALVRGDRDEEGMTYAGSRIKAICVGTAPLPLKTKRDFEKKYGVEVFESYGLSELLLVTANSRRTPRKDRSVGRLLPEVEIKIVDEAGQPVPAGQEGDILIKTPYIMEGYLNYQSLRPEMADPGDWFSTGDVGRIDADGDLFITGRKKDLIIRGGFNISPRAVEEVLHNHPAVEHAAVVGLPHEFYGEEVAAAIVLKDSVRLDAVRQSLLDLCRQELNPACVPTCMVALEAMPMGSSGKIQKSKVREEVLRLARGSDRKG